MMKNQRGKKLMIRPRQWLFIFYINRLFSTSNLIYLQKVPILAKIINELFGSLHLLSYLGIYKNINPWYTEEGVLIMGLFDFLLNTSSLDY
ncbi:hypothetical protein [Odoribacter lunatus]|uniref:hypothetical protein n=1 Tax=Odoribacter lunatus TaxID=2941335 RepID=UPI0020420A69|nr:hypothetical protein [Odoribacter lunatus]